VDDRTEERIQNVAAIAAAVGVVVGIAIEVTDWIHPSEAWPWWEHLLAVPFLAAVLGFGFWAAAMIVGGLVGTVAEGISRRRPHDDL